MTCFYLSTGNEIIKKSLICWLFVYKQSNPVLFPQKKRKKKELDRAELAKTPL